MEPKIAVNPEKENTTKNKSFANLIETNVEYFFRALFFWEKDDKQLGKYIRFLHAVAFYVTVMWYIVIHTFVPSYILFVLLYIQLLVVWIHHIICSGCILSKIENKMLNDDSGILDVVFEIFGIKCDSKLSNAIIVMCSTLLVFLFTFELIVRAVLLIPK
jgi:hypothetical protein